MEEIVSVLLNDFETLDVFGPIEVFGRLKGNFDPQFYSRQGGAVRNSDNVAVLTKPFSESPSSSYILFVPGGLGTRVLVQDVEFVRELKRLGENANFVLTVCTGSILFSKTGLLNGRRATSNKRAFRWTAEESPSVHWVKKARWVKDGNIYTSSGVSAGIDMSLAYVSEILGYEVAKQLSIEIEYKWNDKLDEDDFAELYP